MPVQALQLVACSDGRGEFLGERSFLIGAQQRDDLSEFRSARANWNSDRSEEEKEENIITLILQDE